MENEEKNNEELKKKAEDTKIFEILVDELKLDQKDIPKTEKGLNTKIKELKEKIEKKMSKLTEEEKGFMRNRREIIRQQRESEEENVLKNKDKKKKKKSGLDIEEE